MVRTFVRIDIGRAMVQWQCTSVCAQIIIYFCTIERYRKKERHKKHFWDLNPSASLQLA